MVKNTNRILDYFSLTHYGNFKKMMHMKKTAGVVNLKKAIDHPHVFAVGATANGTGEITVIESELWLDYGADGFGNAQGAISPDEEAVLLVTAQVEEWRIIPIPADMDPKELHAFILQQADTNGLDSEKPFPFLLVGDFFDLDWHILNGVKQTSGGHDQGGLFNKIKERPSKTDGDIIGFYSATNQGVYTHPG